MIVREGRISNNIIISPDEHLTFGQNILEYNCLLFGTLGHTEETPFNDIVGHSEHLVVQLYTSEYHCLSFGTSGHTVLSPSSTIVIPMRNIRITI